MSSVSKSELQEQERARVLGTRLYRSLGQVLNEVVARYTEPGWRVRYLESGSVPAVASATASSATAPAGAALVQPPGEESEEPTRAASAATAPLPPGEESEDDAERQAFALFVDEHSGENGSDEDSSDEDEEEQSFSLFVENDLEQDSDSDYSLPLKHWERKTRSLSEKEVAGCKERAVRPATLKTRVEREERGPEEFDKRVNCLRSKLKSRVSLVSTVRTGAPTTFPVDVTADCHCTRILAEIACLWSRIDFIIARLERDNLIPRPWRIRDR